MHASTGYETHHKGDSLSEAINMIIMAIANHTPQHVWNAHHTFASNC